MCVVESVWLAIKIYYAKDLAKKSNRTWTKIFVINLFICTSCDILANPDTKPNDCQNLGLPKF